MSEVPFVDAEVKDAEMNLAVQLIEQIAVSEFHPEVYEDEVRKRYLEAIRKKVEGQEVTAQPEKPRAQIIDLMEALKASLAAKSTAAEAAAAEPVERESKATGTDGAPRALRAVKARRQSPRKD
jgi:DNA end-binding protein Ku